MLEPHIQQRRPDVEMSAARMFSDHWLPQQCTAECSSAGHLLLGTYMGP